LLIADLSTADCRVLVLIGIVADVVVSIRQIVRWGINTTLDQRMLNQQNRQSNQQSAINNQHFASFWVRPP
jgi:hypothetical protein